MDNKAVKACFDGVVAIVKFDITLVGDMRLLPSSFLKFRSTERDDTKYGIGHL